MTTNSWLFRFYVDDGAGEQILLGCTAITLFQAEAAVAAAGYTSFTLFDQRPLEEHETVDAANTRLLANPFLGPEWMPLVDVIEHVTLSLAVEKFWVLQTYGRHYAFDPHSSPYVQAMLIPDGSLHVEMCGRNTTASSLSEKQYSELEFLGWTSPVQDAPDLPVDAIPIPNSHRVFEPGWNARAVAEFFLTTLAMVFDITAEDFFNFGEPRQEQIHALALLERVDDGPIFCLPRVQTKESE